MSYSGVFFQLIFWASSASNCFSSVDLTVSSTKNRVKQAELVDYLYLYSFYMEKILAVSIVN